LETLLDEEHGNWNDGYPSHLVGQFHPDVVDPLWVICLSPVTPYPDRIAFANDISVVSPNGAALISIMNGE
jgi:hypothetical protein